MKKINCIPALLFIVIMLVSCSKEEGTAIDYRQEMRLFVEKISREGRTVRPGFIVIPQNGLALLSSDGTAGGSAATDYLNAIDGVAQEELFYGYDNNDDMPTTDPEQQGWLDMCGYAASNGKKVMVIDYCSSPEKIQDSYFQNYSRGFISFPADHRNLDNIPAAALYQTDSLSIDSLQHAQNFLYLISPSAFASKEAMLTALQNSAYDLIVLDLYFDEETILTSADLDRLRNKPQGGTRKLICYMSIGQAENYRWYWKNYWYANQPSFIIGEDQNWVDNYYVRYWDQDWQETICGKTDSYLKRVLDAGFDGVYLDLVNAYEYFEE